MPGYFVLLVDINDHDRYAEYARAVPPTYARYGGRMAITGPVVEVIEGILEVREGHPASRPGVRVGRSGARMVDVPGLPASP